MFLPRNKNFPQKNISRKNRGFPEEMMEHEFKTRIFGMQEILKKSGKK